MATGTWIRAGIVIVAATAGSVWLVGSFTSRGARTIRLTSLVPADAELGGGTAIVSGRSGIGTVGKVLDPSWALPLEIRSGVRHRAWTPVVLAAGDSAAAGPEPSRIRVRLDRSDSLFTLAPPGAEPLVLRRDESGEWTGVSGSSGPGILLNGDSVPPGKPIRARPGDVLTAAGSEVRLGPFGRFKPVELRFTTRKLCADHPGSGFFPDSAERARCRERMLGGAAQLEFGGTFGLTKPILKLTPSYGESGAVEQPGRDRLGIAVKRDLQTEVGEMLAYLNSPRSARAVPNTHFEYTLARVDQTLESIDSSANGITAVVHTIHTALKSPDGMGPLALGEAGYRSLRQNLDHVDRILGPIADSTGTLVQRVGLGRMLDRADTTLDRADRAIEDVQGQLDRLAPRMELAAEGTARTIEGAEGTLVALKAAAEDIQSIKKGIQGSKKYAIGGGITWVLTQLAVGIAALKYLVH